jgi:MTH538 TIR-like domain (DUF1863)
MARRIFISYQHEDRMKGKGFNLLRWNKNVDFEFVGRHLLDPVDSKNENYIAQKVKEQLSGTSVTVVLLGRGTENSKWVQWEIEQSVEKKNGVLAIKLSDDVPDPSKESPVGKALCDTGAEIIGWDVSKFEPAIERTFKAAGRADVIASVSSGTGCGR